MTLAGGDVVEAPVVVNVGGPHSSVINQMAGVTGDMRIGHRPLRNEMFAVPAPSGFALDDGATIVADLDIGQYFRPQIGGTLLVGGTEPDCDELEWIDDPDNFREQPTVEIWETSMFRLARRMPEFGVPSRPVGLAALYDASDDWVPIYDKSSLAGFYMACGTSGNQFKNAPLAGQFIRALVDAAERGHRSRRGAGAVRRPPHRTADQRRRVLTTSRSGGHVRHRDGLRRVGHASGVDACSRGVLMGVRRMTAAVVVECGDQLGECPVWDAGRSELLWTDIHGRRLHRLTSDGSSVEFALDDRLCSFAVTVRAAIWWRRSRSASPASTATPARCASSIRSSRMSPRPGATTAVPIVTAGSCSGPWTNRTTPASRSGRSTTGMPSVARRVIHPGVAIANGLCFSPDGLTIYYADSPLGTIWQARYDPDSGRPPRRRVCSSVPTPSVPGDTGSPDGVAVDESGCVWNARWGAWGIARYTPDGVLDTIVDVPVPQPSAVTFGGDDLGTLYITTAREHMSPSDPRYELSGALFAVTPGVTGIADTPVRV